MIIFKILNFTTRNNQKSTLINIIIFLVELNFIKTSHKKLNTAYCFN